VIEETHTMTKLRTFMGVLALAFVVSGGTFGDSSKQDPPKAKGMLPNGWKQLGLTDAQKQKVYEIQAKYREKIDEIERQIKEMKTKEREELFEVLTKEQKDQLRKILSEKGPPDPTKDGDKEPDKLDK
jgi:Spy/CpxP family protein refolding chaperone